MLYDMLL